MTKYVRCAIGIGVLVKAIGSEWTAWLSSAGCLRKVLARHSGHTGLVSIHDLGLLRMFGREEMCGGCDKSGRSTAKGATLDRAGGHHI